MKLFGSLCQCTVCGEVFSGERAFNDHRTGEYEGRGGVNTRSCLPPEVYEALGYRKTFTGVWRKLENPS